MKFKKQQIEPFLRRISNILLINGSFIDNSGLYTGKMGLVLFFLRYARYTQNELYLDYSLNLIEKIQNNIHLDTPIDYKQGLTGIGSAIEYLVQNNYFEADTDEVLEDFDKQIFLKYNLPYLSIDEIMSVGYYALWRISGNSSNKDILQQIILPQVLDVMEKWCEIHKLTHPAISFFRDTIVTSSNEHSIIPAWYQLCRKNYLYAGEKADINHTLENTFFVLDNLELGFQNGLAGQGISLLTKLDKDDSWVSLFPGDLISSKNESLSIQKY